MWIDPAKISLYDPVGAGLSFVPNMLAGGSSRVGSLQVRPIRSARLKAVPGGAKVDHYFGMAQTPLFPRFNFAVQNSNHLPEKSHTVFEMLCGRPHNNFLCCSP